MNKLLRPFRKHRPDIDTLSEHVDGRLNAARAAEIEAHIATCTACREAHSGLVETRALLAAMPEVGHPRSFRLRQADVEAPVRPPARARGSSAAMRWAPACAAVSAVVFVVVLGADFASRDSNSTAEFSSLESSDRIGMTAADDSADGENAPAAGSTAPETDPGTTGDTATDSGATEAAREGQGVAPQPQDAAEPTGAPPSGDAPVEGASGAAPDTGADADATAAANAGGSSFVPPTPTPAALGAVPPEVAAPMTQADADVEQFSKNDADDGNRNGFLFVEITAAAIAVLAGAAYVAWRWMRRGNAA